MIRDDEWHARNNPDEVDTVALDQVLLNMLSPEARPFYSIHEDLQDNEIDEWWCNLPPRRYYESLKRLYEAGKADLVYGEGWRLAPAEWPPMTREQALEIVCDAALNWQNELDEYIIPADENRDDEDGLDTTANRNEMSRLIGEAVELLSKEEQ